MPYDIARKIVWAVFILSLFVCVPSALSQELSVSSSIKDRNDELVERSSVKIASSKDIPEFAEILIRAYPEQKLRYEDNAIIWPDGSCIPYDDGLEKSFEKMLDTADIEDMSKIAYSRDAAHIPEYLEDPGRIRCEAFYKNMYGRDAGAVKKNLVSVSWFGHRIKFTKVNGAASQLEKVAAEIAEKYPEYVQYMVSSGTWYWRKVRHANRLSAHSYGIAIDIAVKFSDYWKWANPKATELSKFDYKNRIPMEIVNIFEKHGFIWGGRWYHFDTMHFEYRPEFVMSMKQAVE